VAGSDPALVTAMVAGNAGPTAAALARVQAQLARPWPELVAAGAEAAAAHRSAARRTVRVPLDRAALLELGRLGGAVTGRHAAFLEGWVPQPG
jgi:prephenate dehydrogenase